MNTVAQVVALNGFMLATLKLEYFKNYFALVISSQSLLLLRVKSKQSPNQ